MSIQGKYSAPWQWQRALRGRMPAKYMTTAFVLSTYANKTGGKMHPGIARLQEATGQSRATVVRHLAWLEADGWVECTTRGGKGSGRPGMANLYQLTVPPTQSSAQTEEAVLTTEHPSTQLTSTYSLNRERAKLVRPEEIDPKSPNYSPEAVAEWVEAILPDLWSAELRVLDGMSNSYKPQHWLKIVNKIEKDRRAA